MTTKFKSGIYNEETLKYKDKQHKNNLWYIRRFITKTQKIFSSEDFTLGEGENWIDYTPFQLLYDVAKATDWINQVEYNLKTFIGCYLTEEEKQIFNIVYRAWIIEVVEYTISVEEGIAEDDESVQDTLTRKRKLKEYDGTNLPPYVDQENLNYKEGRQLVVHYKLFTAGHQGSTNYMREYPLSELHDQMNWDYFIDRMTHSIARQLQSMFEEEQVKQKE